MSTKEKYKRKMDEEEVISEEGEVTSYDVYENKSIYGPVRCCSSSSSEDDWSSSDISIWEEDISMKVEERRRTKEETKFLNLCEEGDLELVKALLIRDPSLINSKNTWGKF